MQLLIFWTPNNMGYISSAAPLFWLVLKRFPMLFRSCLSQRMCQHEARTLVRGFQKCSQRLCQADCLECMYAGACTSHTIWQPASDYKHFKGIRSPPLPCASSKESSPPPFLIPLPACLITVFDACTFTVIFVLCSCYQLFYGHTGKLASVRRYFIVLLYSVDTLFSGVSDYRPQGHWHLCCDMLEFDILELCFPVSGFCRAAIIFHLFDRAAVYCLSFRRAFSYSS